MMRLRREIQRLLHPSQHPWGAVLMLHRIDAINPDRLWYNEHLKLSPEYLDNFVCVAKKKGFSFVSLDEIAEIISRKKRVRKLLAITFDDGYKDNFSNGLPVLKKHSVPFCIYIATILPEKKMIYWWYIIEDIILTKNNVVLGDGKTFFCDNKEAKEQTFLSIREDILKLPQEDFEKKFVEMLNRYAIDLYKYNDCLPLTWEMIEKLTSEPLATIGCHTHSHISMAGCSNETIIKDIEKAQRLMSDKAGYKPKHFAFPYGESTAVTQNDVELVKNIGFTTSATTDYGFLNHNTDLLELPRIFVTERNGMQLLEQLSIIC